MRLTKDNVKGFIPAVVTPFNERGEIRLVSYEALDRFRLACRENMKLEKQQDSDAIRSLLGKVDEMQKDIRQLSKCVSILASGGRPEDC